MTFFDNKMKIDDCVQNNQKINLYEVLTPKGISLINNIILKNNNSEILSETIDTDIPNTSNNEEDKNFLISKYISQKLKQRKNPNKDEIISQPKFDGEFPVKIEHYIQNKGKFYLFESYWRRNINFTEDLLMMSTNKKKKFPSIISI